MKALDEQAHFLQTAPCTAASLPVLFTLLYQSMDDNCDFYFYPRNPSAAESARSDAHKQGLFFPRLTSNDIKVLEMPCICLDAHAQSCLPAAAMSSCGQLKAADKFLTLKASPEMDWTTPKWRGLSEAPRSASLPTHYQVHPSFLRATTSTWKSQAGGDLFLSLPECFL